MHAYRARSRAILIVAAVAAAAVLAGCGSTPKGGGGGGSGRGGGYYKDDGPGSNPPPDLDKVPDALPAVEPLASGSNKPYVVFGKQYVPGTSLQPYRMKGLASWYGRKFHGARTSNGELYDMYAMTAAHTTLPIPSYARVTRTATGKSVIVRVNDRGPFHDDRIIDLSYTAALKLGILGPGSAEVVVESLMPDQIAQIRAERSGDRAVAAATVLQAPEPVAGDGSAVAVASALPVAFSAGPSTQVRELAPLQTIPSGIQPQPSPMPDSTGTSGAQAPVTGLVASAPVYAQGAPGPTGSLQPSSNPGAPAAYASPAPLASGIYLQLGAFSGLQNAQALASRLRSQLGDWPEPIRVVSTDNLHRVHVGPYASRDSALAAAEILRARTAISPVIVAR